MNDYGSFPTQPLPIARPRKPIELRGVNPSAHPDAAARAGRQLALAGMVSRVTGFARTLAVAAVLGTAAVGDAYNGANNFPNMVYELLLGSVLAAAVVPVLIRARRHSRKHSREFTQRLMLAIVLVLAVVTAATVACAPLIARVFVDDPGQRHLTTLLAYLLLPQIFFYGLTVIAGAVLNVRDSFATAAWAPVVNNAIVLVTCGIFVLLPGPIALTPATMTTAQVLTLGIGTTAGIAGQAAWVITALRRNGFEWSWHVRPLPYTWRPVRAGLPVLGWLLVYAAISQVGVIVSMRIAFAYGGVSISGYADLLFQVPYGILAVSVLTVLMPRISRAAARGDRPAMLADLARGARYLTTALVPVTMAMILLVPALAPLVFTGRVGVADAHLIGTVVACSAFGLGPFALVMLQMRVFYADNDTRTPALMNLVMVATKVGTVTLSAVFLSHQAVIVMLGVSGSLSYVAGALTGHLLLRRRHGLLGFSAVAATFRNVAWATACAGIAGLLAISLTHHLIPTVSLERLLSPAVGAMALATVFVLVARAIGIPELRIVRTLLARP